MSSSSNRTTEMLMTYHLLPEFNAPGVVVPVHFDGESYYDAEESQIPEPRCIACFEDEESACQTELLATRDNPSTNDVANKYFEEAVQDLLGDKSGGWKFIHTAEHQGRFVKVVVGNLNNALKEKEVLEKALALEKDRNEVLEQIVEASARKTAETLATWNDEFEVLKEQSEAKIHTLEVSKSTVKSDLAAALAQNIPLQNQLKAIQDQLQNLELLKVTTDRDLTTSRRLVADLRNARDSRDRKIAENDRRVAELKLSNHNSICELQNMFNMTSERHKDAINKAEKETETARTELKEAKREHALVLKAAKDKMGAAVTKFNNKNAAHKMKCDELGILQLDFEATTKENIELKDEMMGLRKEIKGLKDGMESMENERPKMSNAKLPSLSQSQLDKFFTEKAVSHAVAEKEAEVTKKHNGEVAELKKRHNAEVAYLSKGLQTRDELILEFTREQERQKERLAQMEEEKLRLAKQEGMNQAYASILEFAGSKMA